MNYNDRAEILVKALPYIQEFSGKTIVIKYGGNAMISDELRDAVMTDIVLLSAVGIKVVLVHGGGPEISSMLNKVGKESKFVDGLRYTDEETIDVVEMVLAGKINKELVRLLNSHGGKAVGYCGIDGGMLTAEKVKGDKDLGYVGNITEVDTSVINAALENGYVPIIAPLSASKDSNQLYNVNADSAAAKIAAELGAEKILLMTDVRGLLRDKDDENTLVSFVNVSDVPALKKQKIISGGMIPKIDCCVEAVRRGVNSVHIIDGRIPHSIIIELLSCEGIGTMIAN